MKPTRFERAFEAFVGVIFPLMILSLSLYIGVRTFARGGVPWVGFIITAFALVLLKTNYQAWQRWKRSWLLQARKQEMKISARDAYDSDFILLTPGDPMYEVYAGAAEHGAAFVEWNRDGSIKSVQYADGHKEEGS